MYAHHSVSAPSLLCDIRQVIYPHCWLLHLLDFYLTFKTRKTHHLHEGFPGASAEVFSRVTSFLGPCRSPVSGPPMTAALSGRGQLYPKHTVLLGFSSSPSLVALTSTSWRLWSMTTAWLGVSPCFCHCHGAEACLGFIAGVDADRVFSALLMNRFFLPNIPHHFACSAIIMLM